MPEIAQRDGFLLSEGNPGQRVFDGGAGVTTAGHHHHHHRERDGH